MEKIRASIAFCLLVSIIIMYFGAAYLAVFVVCKNEPWYCKLLSAIPFALFVLFTSSKTSRTLSEIKEMWFYEKPTPVPEREVEIRYVKTVNNSAKTNNKIVKVS